MNSTAFDDTISSCVPNRTTVFSSPETTIDCSEKNDKREEMIEITSFIHHMKTKLKQRVFL